MGVKNLWRLLLPISRRISIQSLSHQTLAIDASIWLTQISKACRDPETGRLLPNRPHVRIFLLRLMRLLFHEIRPVVVFDGAMPEVKRREIQRRKGRREKLWRDEEDGEEGGGALKRTAKKILVQRLKEWRTKEAKLTGVEDVADVEDVGSKQMLPSSANVSGAFAAGFVPADSQKQQNSSVQHQSTNQEPDALDEAPKSDEADNEIISIHSDHELDQLSANNNDADSENDWEMSHAVQSSINASLSNQQSSNPHEETNILPETSNVVIAALPTITRSQWIDSQFRAQRIQSRQECISVAGNMEEYSSTQIRNFLKGSRLNKRMNDIGALAGKSAVENGGGGAAIANAENVTSNANGAPNVSMEVLFGEPDGDGDNISSDEESAAGGFLSSLDQQRSNPKPLELNETNADECLREMEDDSASNEQADTEDSPVNHEQNSEQNTDTTLANGATHNQPFNLVALASAQDEWAAWGNDDESEEETIPRKSNGAVPEHNTTALQNDDSDSDEEGGTFLTLACGSNNAKNFDTNNNQIEDTKQTASDEADNKSNDSNADMSVDWEDGDSGDEALDATANETNETNLDDDSTSNTAKALMEKREIQDCSSKSNDFHSGITVEDTSATENAKAAEKHKDLEDVSSKDNCHVTDPPKSDEESVSDTLQQAEVSTQENHINEFDIPLPKNPNIAALKHAQETASKLTNWAGRAVQRAFASHLEHQKDQSSPQERSTSKADEESNDDNQSPKPPTSQKTTGSPHNNVSKRQVEFLDTSLEGLNAAHIAILEEEKLMERDLSTITDEMKEDILKLLQLCGIPWIESPAEAEAQCAALEELGLVDGVVTEDSDIFVFGGRKVYKNFFNEQSYVEAYYARDAQKELGLGKNQLISLAMLLGGDYTDGVKGVGIVNGMEILQAFPVDDVQEGLKEFRDWLDGFGDDPKLPDNDGDGESTFATRKMQFHKKHKSARTRWIAPADFPSQAIINAYTKPVVDKSNAKFSWAKPDIKGLQQFCSDSLGWEKEDTERVVLPVLEVLQNKSKQRRLESYFMKYDDGIKFAEASTRLFPLLIEVSFMLNSSIVPFYLQVRSKRLKTVLEGIQDKSNKDATEVETSAVHNPKKKRSR